MRALVLSIVLMLASACTPATRQQHTTMPSPASVTQPACQVRLPDDWVRTVADARVDTGSYPVASGPAGEVVARRGGDLVLIKPDATVATVYTSPNPADDAPDIAAINDRWIVVGVLRSKGRNVNGDEPVKRIDVVDRQDGSVRTVVETPAADLEVEHDWIDSLAVFGDAVYWITRREESGSYGTLRSYDASTGSTTTVESGDMRGLDTTATGLTWSSIQPQLHSVFYSLAALPDAIAAVTGINDDQSSLVRDGDAYAWITGVFEGGTGVARWAPDTGVRRISTLTLFDRRQMDDSPRDVRRWSRGLRVQPRLFLSGPYVVVGGSGATQSTIIDTRSGAVTPLGREALGATGGSIAFEQPDPSGTGQRPPGVGFAELDRLPPLTCPSSGSTRSTCEVPLPGAWHDALSDSVVDTGSSTTPLAVGPGGEIAAGYEDDDSGRLLLIDDERSVRTVYRVVDPDGERVGFAAVDARRIVVGVVIRDRLPGGGRLFLDDGDVVNNRNAGPPTLIRIDVIDRSTNAIRTVMSRSAGAPVIRSRDSVAVFGDTVYWTTAADDEHAVVRSYDMNSGALAEIASAYSIDDLRATPVGVAWTESERDPDPTQPLQDKPMSRQVAELPSAVVAAGANPDDATLTTDGTAYAWRTDAGITHWSPDAGVTRVDVADGLSFVDGPYVVGSTTVLDTRSGAIASLDPRVVVAGGGTLATDGRARDVTIQQAGLVRLADLPPLTCGG